jgi:hypothetical protein
MSDTPMWPPSFAELNIEDGDIQIKPEDIASYAYPPWQKERYTTTGWGKALQLMMRHGIPIPAEALDVRWFGATPGTPREQP